MNEAEQLEAIAIDIAGRIPRDMNLEVAATFMVLDVLHDMLALAEARSPALALASAASPQQEGRTAGIFVGLMLSARAPTLASFFLENMHRSSYGDMPEVTADVAKLAWDMMTSEYWGTTHED